MMGVWGGVRWLESRLVEQGGHARRRWIGKGRPAAPLSVSGDLALSSWPHVQVVARKCVLGVFMGWVPRGQVPYI
jgi:hypothetical protein